MDGIETQRLTGDRGVVITNILLALGPVSVVNAGLWALGNEQASATSGGALLPSIPGWAIGAVWTGLFAGMGAARGQLIRVGSPSALNAARWVLGLALFCAAYPIYTLGLRSNLLGFVGNIATMGLAAFVTAKVAPINKRALGAPVSVIAWLMFATVIIADEVGWFRSAM